MKTKMNLLFGYIDSEEVKLVQNVLGSNIVKFKQKLDYDMFLTEQRIVTTHLKLQDLNKLAKLFTVTVRENSVELNKGFFR